MRRYLKLTFIVIAALDRTDVPVVSGVWIRGGKRESRFQIRIARVPVNDVTELHSISSIACRQTHRLPKLRTLGFAHDLNGHAHWTMLDHTHLNFATNIRPRRLLLVCPIHVPSRPLCRRIVLNRKTNRSRKQLAVDLLIKNTRDVSVSI